MFQTTNQMKSSLNPWNLHEISAISKAGPFRKAAPVAGFQSHECALLPRRGVDELRGVARLRHILGHGFHGSGRNMGLEMSKRATETLAFIMSSCQRYVLFSPSVEFYLIYLVHIRVLKSKHSECCAVNTGFTHEKPRFQKTQTKGVWPWFTNNQTTSSPVVEKYRL